MQRRLFLLIAVLGGVEMRCGGFETGLVYALCMDSGDVDMKSA